MTLSSSPLLLLLQLSSLFLLLLVASFTSITPAQAWLNSAAGATFTNSRVSPPPPPSNVKILILPGFFNDSSDYVLERAPHGSLVQSLRRRGWRDDQIRVLPVRRTDWLQVFARGCFDAQFWRGVAAPTRPAFAWYLDRVAAAVEELTAATASGSRSSSSTSIEKNPSKNDSSEDDDSDPPQEVLLISHSAGGWLARAVLGYFSLEEENGDDDKQQERKCILDKVCGLVTLGAPHQPPPDTVMDMTRGALKQTCRNFPGAYHSDNLFYVTVIGDAVQGVKQERQNPLEPTSPSGFAYNSYEAVCGDGTTVGDGVVPCVAAHLEGATQLDLEGVFHSINEPDRWYGSERCIDLWYEEVLKQLEHRQRQRRGDKGTFQNPFESIFSR